MRRLSGASVPEARKPGGPLSCGGGPVRGGAAGPVLSSRSRTFRWHLTSKRTGTTAQGWGATRCRPCPTPSWPISSREKGPAVDRSVGGSEAARRPRSRGPMGSKGTRPSSAPCGTPRRTTWEKCGRGSPGFPLEPSPVTSTSSWVWRPGTGEGRKEQWLREVWRQGEKHEQL